MPMNMIMSGHTLHRNFLLALGVLLVVIFLTACTRSASIDVEPWQPGVDSTTLETPSLDLPDPVLPNARPPGSPVLTPTPDDPHPLPGLRTEPEQYVIQAGDILGAIAERYGVTVEEIAEASGIANIHVLEIGQMLTIPAPDPVATGPGFKIIPDSELIAGPTTIYFDVADFAYSQNGYLVRYEEEMGDLTLSGVQIVQLIARDFSVNPRLLLAAIEYQSGWVTNTNPRSNTLKYPMGWADSNREGLYKQLAWAANELNRGYYLWRVNVIATWVLADGVVVPIDPTINAGTAGVQHFFAQLYGKQLWEKSVVAEGFFSTYERLFGYPFDYAYEPVLPVDLTQPVMQLPFEVGADWAFTGGPHGGWGDGSAWAALDFAPPGDALGCVQSDAWVVASADGLILRAEEGAVVQDLDGDGFEQTGWTILYMHIETRDRVQPGTYLRAGERIGHPSCEGGFSNGTHVHIARRYNGEWIPADQAIPLVLDNWVSVGAGIEYDGYLQKNGISIEAWDGRSPENTIQR
jgi:LasA protease